MPDAAKDFQDERHPVSERDRGEDAVDVVEGEVGSAKLKEPAEVEAEAKSDDAADPPG